MLCIFINRQYVYFPPLDYNINLYNPRNHVSLLQAPEWRCLSQLSPTSPLSTVCTSRTSGLSSCSLPCWVWGEVFCGLLTERCGYCVTYKTFVIDINNYFFSQTGYLNRFILLLLLKYLYPLFL